MSPPVLVPNADKKQGEFNSERWITCYKCHQKGHKKADCHVKTVSRIITPHMEDDQFVSGKAGEKEIRLVKVDTGSQQMLVHPKIVSTNDYTGEHTVIGVTGGATSPLLLARVWLHFGAFSLHATVAVTDTGPDEALLGIDMGIHMSYVPRGPS